MLLDGVGLGGHGHGRGAALEEKSGYETPLDGWFRGGREQRERARTSRKQTRGVIWASERAAVPTDTLGSTIPSRTGSEPDLISESALSTNKNIRGPGDTRVQTERQRKQQKIAKNTADVLGGDGKHPAGHSLDFAASLSSFFLCQFAAPILNLQRGRGRRSAGPARAKRRREHTRRSTWSRSGNSSLSFFSSLFINLLYAFDFFGPPPPPDFSAIRKTGTQIKVGLHVLPEREEKTLVTDSSWSPLSRI